VRGLRDRPEFAWGEDAEDAIALKLQLDGCVVLKQSQYKHHDHAPVLYSIEHETKHVRTVLADLITWERGRPPLFAEVKRKNRWVNFRDPDQPDRGLETGFDEHLWKHYLRAQEATGTSLLVFWVHEKRPPTGVYVSTIEALARPGVRRPWDGWPKNQRRARDPQQKPPHDPMSLFPLSALKRFCDIGELKLKHQPAQGEMALPSKRVALSSVPGGGDPRAHGLKPSLAKCTEPLVQPQSQALQTNFFDVVDEPQRRASGERVRR